MLGQKHRYQMSAKANSAVMPTVVRFIIRESPVWGVCVKEFLIRAFASISAFLVLALPVGTAGEAAFVRSLQPFFDSYCVKCHDEETAKADLDLAAVGSDLTQPAMLAKWIRIYDRVAELEMPPKDKKQPGAVERDRFATALYQPLFQAHMAQKGTVLRRLNRREYENTLNDLFGTNVRLADMLPEDGRASEFDTVGAALGVSMVHMQRYIDGAGMVLEDAIARTETAPSSELRAFSYADTRDGNQFFGKVWLKRDDGAVVFFRDGGYPSGLLREANFNRRGRYRIRVTGYAYQSETPVVFSIEGSTYKRGADHPVFAYREMPPSGEPTTFEIEAWLENGYMVEINPFGLADHENEIKKVGLENYKGPGLAILKVEIEGPLTGEFPSRGHHLLFDGINRRVVEPWSPKEKEKSWYKPKFEVVSSDPRADAAAVLLRVATAALRRPVAEERIKPYLELFATELAQGSDFEAALKTAVAAILVSGDFLYLRELPGRMDDYALAARLSYFLNRTMPDDELLKLAAAGKLAAAPGVLRQQVDRLLGNDKAERFGVDFTDAWLNLRDLEFTTPDSKLFPEYDPFLLESMKAETRGYFTTLLVENLPVTNVVRSDFAMLNSRLAAHYGIDGVSGTEIQKVKLAADSLRGGFLTQASVLKVSANGTNTSPVVRGAWVMTRILNQPPPPPPPGIPGVEPDIRGASTLREILEKHRNMESCRSCHQKIDPPGFALESFDPVGRYRERFRVLGGEKTSMTVKGRKVNFGLGQPVDASGEMPDQRKFAGFVEFRDYLAADERTLARALATKLLVFGTGREMGFSDRAEIDRIVESVADSGYRVRDLLQAVVASDIFRSK